jgi:hypothetical protein
MPNPSPTPKADEDLARVTFYTDCAKVKSGLALGVRVNAIVGRCLGHGLLRPLNLFVEH